MRSLDDSVQLSVTFTEAMTLRSSLRRYIAYWMEHAAEDEYATHNEADVETIRIEAGRLIWRLEEATAIPGAKLTHSSDAVPPEAL